MELLIIQEFQFQISQVGEHNQILIRNILELFMAHTLEINSGILMESYMNLD